jgi:L-gulonolactone oxidase
LIFQNWARQYRCEPASVLRCGTVAEVQAAVRGSNHLRVFGSGHSPSDIAMSDADLMVLDGIDRVLSVDGLTVRAQGGIKLHRLEAVLREHGLALPNLGSIAEQTLAGALATGTHGTGRSHGVLPTLVRELTLVTADGELLRLTPADGELWQAARCHLGTLGVAVEVVLEVCPMFDLEALERETTLEEVLENLDQRLQADHYRFWYLPHADRVWEWSAARVPPGAQDPQASWRDHLLGYRAFEFLLWLTCGFPALLPAVNRWYANTFFRGERRSRKPSLAGFTFNCLFRQQVNEWCIPLEHTGEALRRLRQLVIQAPYPVHLPIEVRFTAADDVWMSPSYGRESCWIGVILYKPYGRQLDSTAYFRDFETLMLELDGRPHWAKRFGPEATAMARSIPRFGDFLAVVDRLDPTGKFRNDYTRRVLGR